VTSEGPWRLDTAGQTLVLAGMDGQVACLWWGTALPGSEDLAAFAAAHRRDLSGGMLDRLPALTLTPQPGEAWQGAPGIVLAEADGTPLVPRFRLSAVEQAPGRLVFRSVWQGMALTHSFVAQATGTVTARTRLVAPEPVRCQWLAAPVLPGPQEGAILDPSGRWSRELQWQRSDWTPGQRVREARTGRSGQEHPPFAIFAGDGCTNCRGNAWGLSYAWSGGHRLVAEELQDGRRQVQMGHAVGAWGAAGTVFETADLILAVSATGLNGIGTAFQRDLRDRVVTWPDRARPRPVHYNCWEAIYFGHRLDTLCEIADRAAEIGVDRFVLDDGWFGRRDDDTTSLGDWGIDRRKWPDGLTPLIDHVTARGMRFGLWVEPEMVNPDSDLYRAHPDWALGPADQLLGRHQMVLDLANPAVVDHLFAVLDALLRDHDIDYLKWDHNRLLPVVSAAQTEGVYALLDRLRAAHPGVEIESCASGGGRIDAGILARTHRVWLSDCIDAVERLQMQHDAALVLPAGLTGSHVGAERSHTTGRVLPMSFRARVAAMRHFGFEMDLRRLAADEQATLAAVTAWWKANRGWTMAGDILRLDSADPAVTAEMQVAADGGRFVVFAGVGGTTAQTLPRPLRLAGLDPQARYRVALLNPEDAPPQSRGPVALKSGPLVLTGAALMGHGLHLPLAWPATMWMVEGLRLEG
jgi:alpha-galactosidase